jgi:hypothetical protein
VEIGSSPGALCNTGRECRPSRPARAIGAGSPQRVALHNATLPKTPKCENCLPGALGKAGCQRRPPGPARASGAGRGQLPRRVPVQRYYRVRHRHGETGWPRQGRAVREWRASGDRPAFPVVSGAG